MQSGDTGKMLHPAVRVLRAMLDGQRVDFNGTELAIGEDAKGRLVFGAVYPAGSDSVIAFALPVGSFINWCAELPEENLVSISAGRVLTEYTQRRGPRG